MNILHYNLKYSTLKTIYLHCSHDAWRYGGDARETMVTLLRSRRRLNYYIRELTDVVNELPDNCREQRRSYRKVVINLKNELERTHWINRILEVKEQDPYLSFGLESKITNHESNYNQTAVGIPDYRRD